MYIIYIIVCVHVCVCVKTLIFNSLMYIVIHQKENIDSYLVKIFIEFPLYSRY